MTSAAPIGARTRSNTGPRLVGNVEISAKLPSNREAERSLLGAIILENSAIKAAMQIVQPEHFFGPDHQVIFSAMIRMFDAGKPIDTVLLLEELDRSGQLEDAGGAAYLSSLPDGLPRATNVPYYAQIVRSKATMRDYAHVGLALHERAMDPRSEPADLLPHIEAIERLKPEKVPEARALVIPDMPDGAADPFFGELCDRRLRDLPLAYAYTALLTVASTLVPQSSDQDVRTNLYTCLVGSKGSGKSTSIERAIRILGISSPHLVTTLAGSAEGLFEKLSTANGEGRLLSPDELGHLLTKAKIDGASFPYVLNTGFYKREFDIVAARGRKIYVNCALSIIGGVVEENFQQAFGAATTAGLHDRFIFGQCPSPFEFHYRPCEGNAEVTEPCPVTIDRQVWEAHNAWKSSSGVHPRSAEQAIRIAVICAAFTGRLILRANALGPAQKFAEYQSGLRKVLQPNPGENADACCAFAVLNLLEQNPGWNPRRQVSRKIHADRYGPHVFERAINALRSAGEIDEDRKKPARIRRVAGA